MLFRDRNLNIAILLSASWHLICVFLVAPVHVSGNIRENSTRISFLGSILQKVAAVPEKPFSLDRVSLMQKIERARDADPGQLSLTRPENTSVVQRVESDKEGFVSFGDRHETIAFKAHYKKGKRPRIKFKDAAISGKAKNRVVLYKPDLPKVSFFTSYFSSNYNVGIRFEISRHGFVQRPECTVSSGSSEIDQMAIRYIRRWQFVPHGEGLEGGQEGAVRVSFK